jgi:glycosidase
MLGGSDPACRGSFPWDESRWDMDLRDTIRRFIRLRHDHPVLRRGSFVRLYSHRGVYAFLRRLDDEAMLIVLNGSSEGRQVHIPVRGNLPAGTVVEDVWGAESLIVADGRLRDVRLYPLEGRVFRHSSPS